MNVHVTIPLFERRTGDQHVLTTVGLGPLDRVHYGANAGKLEQRIADELRAKIGEWPVRDLDVFDRKRNTRIERVRVELTLEADAGLAGPGAGLGKRKVSGVLPLVVTPAWASPAARVEIACHPFRTQESWPVRPDVPLDEQARLFFSHAWRNLVPEAIKALWSDGKETLRVLAFTAGTKSLLDELPAEDAAPWEIAGDPALRKQKRAHQGYKVLRRIATNLSIQIAHGTRATGLVRGNGSAKLAELLGATKRKSAVLVGPPGSGKTTAVHQAVRALLELDGYFLHRNLDRCREAWLVSGKRLIAGMSYVGDWEQRCLDLIEDARSARVILVVEDLYHFGRIGRSRQSDRCLADLFRGPIARREIVVVGEHTPERMRLLEDEAPALASLLSPIPVPEATRAETMRLLLHEARAIDLQHDVRILPFSLRSLVDMSATLLPGRVLPGKAVDLARELAKSKAPGEGNDPVDVTSGDVLELLSAKTGMPRQILRTESGPEHADVERALGRQVMGQPDAVRAMADLVIRIKIGAVDAQRPYGVFLFTGPTGTGKTELAKCLAEYLFGSPSRLLRFDMSELSGPEAASRLIGDRWSPEGLLTTAVQQRPHAVVLLDEIEKAHRSVHHLFLQLFEDGRLTDAAGVTAHFAHTVVIMTSNLGGRARPAVGFGESPDAVMRDVARAVREFFSPELLNRIDRIVPFRPLTLEVAADVASKELEKMLARRGLAERSIFVSRSASATRKVAEVAFRAEDGARSIKRYLESTIGSALTDAITKGTPGAVQMFHVDEKLDEKDDGFVVDRRVLAEIDPISARFAIEPLLGLDVNELRPHLAEALEMVRSLEYGGDIDRLSSELSAHLAEHNTGSAGHADAIYDLDTTRFALSSFRARLERVLSSNDRERDYEDVEVKRFGRVEVTHADDYRGSVERVRTLDRRAIAGHGIVKKEEMLACLSESHFLRRALGRASQEGQHAVFVELRAMSSWTGEGRFDDREAGLLEWLADAYQGSGHGAVDDWAIRRRDGAVVTGRDALGTLSTAVASHVVLKIVGFCVLDHFELEQGSHLRHALASGPEVVRVRVTPAAPGVTAEEILRADRDPREILPVVRTVRYDPASGSNVVAIEDYAIAWTAKREARSLREALAPLWLYRASRELLPKRV